VVRALRTHGGERRYQHERLGFNARLDALEAAVLRVKLPHLSGWIEARRGLAEGYRQRWSAVGGGLPLSLPAGDGPGPARHSYNQFVVRVGEGLRDPLRAHLTALGIGTAVYYPDPLPFLPCFSELGHRRGEFPEAERASAECLALPLYPGLSEAAQDEVVAGMAGFFAARGSG
jgi:dTDP-4-amino-4,6-dideoxygalactose transaminase